MTLLDTATELQLQLDAVSTSDEEDALLSRGRLVRDAIVAATKHFEAAQSYRVTTGLTDAPPLDTKAIRQAIGHFRGALSKSSTNAFQQRPAARLEEVLAAQTKRVDRWITSTWRENFADAKALLERVNTGGLHGSVLARTKVKNRASKIEDVLDLNPVKDRAMLEEHLKVVGLDACIERVNELIEELREAIVSIERDQAEMPPEVRVAIQRATSVDGLPLSEVTPELVAALRSAGVLDDLVVRQL